jgi:FixJ family two-component response regulator
MVATLDQTISTFSSTEQPLVLVVDDEPALQESIAYSLRREGWRVEIARDGVESSTRSRFDRAGCHVAGNGWPSGLPVDSR